jgi:hypothetical protein
MVWAGFIDFTYKLGEKRVWFLKRCAVIRIIVMPLQGTGRLYKISNNGRALLNSLEGMLGVPSRALYNLCHRKNQ